MRFEGLLSGEKRSVPVLKDHKAGRMMREKQVDYTPVRRVFIWHYNVRDMVTVSRASH